MKSRATALLGGTGYVSATLAAELDRFREHPDDPQAFQALEERLFVSGQWPELVALYEARLAAASLAAAPRERARILVRLGGIFVDHLANPPRAESSFRAALAAEARHRPALTGLRRLHLSQARFDVALQIAELELSLEMPPDQRAALLHDVGTIWLEQIRDPELALRHFREALATHPQLVGALAGSARAQEELGRPAEAASDWERAAALLRGSARAEAIAAHARLLAQSLGEPARAAELCRRALTEDPRCAEALELLASLVAETGQWPLLADLLERRFELATERASRGAIALEAGRLRLDRLADPAAARLWLARAEECLPENAAVQLALADLERAGGDDQALEQHLLRVAALGDPPPAPTLVELASLLVERGDAVAALPHLERALELAPDDAVVVDALSELFSQLGRYADLADCLERRAALVGSDPGLRAGILSELGALYEERLDDADLARSAFERAFAADPTTPGLVARVALLCRKSEAWEPLRQMLERGAREGPAQERASHWCSLGELLIERFDDAPAATEAFEAALALDPSAARAHQGRQALAVSSGDAEGVLAAYQREAVVASDPGRLGFLVREISRRLEERGRLPEVPGWVERWTLACPEEGAALELAVETARKLGDPARELDALGRLDPYLRGAPRAARRLRMAELHAAAERHAAAIDACRGALATDASSLAAHALLIEELEREGRVEEATAAHAARIPLLEPSERPAALDALARLQAGAQGNPAGAIATLLRLAEESGAPEDVEERLEELLARSQRHDDLVLRLERRLAAAGPHAPGSRELALRRADLLEGPLARFAEAADAYAELLARHPDLAPARSGLERALRAAGDVPRLVAFLAEQGESHPDLATRERAALECAVLHDEILVRPSEARARLERLFAGASTPAVRDEAGAKLERLLERERAWPELRAHLVARLELAPASEHEALHERLGRVCRDRVSDANAALLHFEAAAALAPQRPELWRSLALLYEEVGRAADLARALEGELATHPTPERERAIRSRVAHLAAGALDEPERAREHYERLLESDPGDATASEFLVAHFEELGRADDLVRVLERRLEALDRRSDADATTRTALRLRIAGLRATRLGDLPGAIALLEPALAELGPIAVVAEPLADLYQRSGSLEALEALCRSAAERAAEGAERAGWLSRLADALRRRGADREAVSAFRDVLTERPGDREARAALRDLHRRLDEPQALARLLEAELAQLAGPAEVPVRMELARLLADRLERRGEALLHLRRVLQVEPGHADALARALALASHASQGEVLRELLDEALARPQLDATRAALLAHRARLRAQVGRDHDAAADLRESLALDPARAEVRDALREQLEQIGDWEGVLACLRVECEAATPDQRGALLDEAAGIAWTRIGPDAALPWLERLRPVTREPAAVAARIAEVHRIAGRSEARLRALEDQAASTPDTNERRPLALERARVLERELGSPARAAALLAEARRTWPADPEILAELHRLLTLLGRDRERAEVIALRLAHADGEHRLALLREAAELWAGPLGEPTRAAELWMLAVEQTPSPGERRAALLRSLGKALRASAPSEVWARCAEAELEALDAADPVFAERRQTLHGDLARVYRSIGRSDAALRHLRPLIDATPSAAGRSRELESALLELLREAGSWIELEQRSTAHLLRWPDAAGWLELARLRDEKLHSPSGAVDAYRRSLELEADSLPALRGLRAAAERVGDWESVAEALEREIECWTDAPRAARAALLRCLGDVAWHRLGATPRASRCYAAALESDPEDFGSLHSFEALLEAMEDWDGAVRLYQSEVEVLGSRNPQRRQLAWLRAGELSRDHLGDAPRARRAYQEAASSGPLPPARLAELAELELRCGDPAAFAASFAAWCDDPATAAGGADHRRLAETLDALGRLPEALARVERALESEPDDLASLDLAASLHERAGDPMRAVAALERAASLAPDAVAAERLVHAAHLVAPGDAERVVLLLRRAAARDPVSAPVHARLARALDRCGAPAEAESAARRALELGSAARSLAEDERFGLVLLGGRCARSRGELEAAARFYAEARRIDPDHPDALAACAEVLCELEDLDGARDALQRRLAAADAYPERAAHLALLARCLEASGDPAEALARCEEALACDAALDDAHARCVRLHERAERIDEGVAALERWAEAAPDAERRAERLLRAAEWELRVSGRERDAEGHLRAAIELHPDAAGAWQGLAWLLWHRGDVDEALRIASKALDHGADDAARGPLALVRGRALERQGARADAAEAYAIAVAADPRCLEAALARARLLRGMGDWRGAAEVLRSFVEQHPGDDPRALAETLHQLGRLLAGPLEDLEGAVDAYERAIRLDPETTELRASLANLLSHRPDRWREALEQQKAVLERDPTHAPTLRAAMRIAGSLHRSRAIDDGLAILRALGVATPSEQSAAPLALSTRIAAGGSLDDPLHEKLRQVAEQAAREIGDALGHSGAPPAPSGDAQAEFRAAALVAEGRLSAPALLPLPTRELREVLLVVASLALEAEDVHGSGRFVNALTAALGRRARRGLRRLLDGVALESLASVDFDAWRSELRGLAAAVALDETGGDLRTAFVALAAESDQRGAPLAPTADLSPLVAGSAEARGLLRRALRTWLAGI
jgi:tetratricopeptide (TPR) repeat protein